MAITPYRKPLLKQSRLAQMSHRQLLAAFLVLGLAGGVVGTLANRHHPSQAANVTPLGSANGFTIQGCKTYESSAYGALYKVNFYFYKPASVNAEWFAYAYRKVNGQTTNTQHPTGTAWLYNNSVAGTTMTVSIPLGDTVWALIGALGNGPFQGVFGGNSGPFNPATLTNC